MGSSAQRATTDRSEILIRKISDGSEYPHIVSSRKRSGSWVDREDILAHANPRRHFGLRRFGRKRSHQSQIFATGSVGGANRERQGVRNQDYLASPQPQCRFRIPTPLSAFPLCGLWISLFEKAPFWSKKKTSIEPPFLD